MQTLQKINITQLPIEEVLPNSYNPNRQSDKDFELLCRSIEEDGFTQPIVVLRDTLRIVDGEHRWRACRALGHKTIACVLVDMDQAQAMISTLRHNRARGEENVAKAAGVIQELDGMGALDAAADSLMMDDVEIELFTKSIPMSELNIRKPEMSFQDTQDSLAAERELQKDKDKEEADMWQEDAEGRFVLQMTFVSEEAVVIKACVGKKAAEGVLQLCREVGEGQF